MEKLSDTVVLKEVKGLWSSSSLSQTHSVVGLTEGQPEPVSERVSDPVPAPVSEPVPAQVPAPVSEHPPEPPANTIVSDRKRRKSRVRRRKSSGCAVNRVAVIRTMKIPCTICLGIYDITNLCTCCRCSSAIHWYCDSSPYIAPVTSDQRWLCRGCHEELSGVRTTSIQKVIDVRTQLGSDDFDYLVKGLGWTKRGAPDKALFVRMARRQKQLASGIEVCCRPRTAGGEWHELCVKSNGTRLGLHQLNGHFDCSELNELESNVKQLLERAKGGELGQSTVDSSPKLNRTKIFLGFRYGYGKEKGSAPQLFDDVDTIDAYPWLKILAHRVAQTVDFPFGEFNQIVLNCYHKKTALLHLHKDETRLFEYPIVSLRLFATRHLSFGYKGQGMVVQPCCWSVKQDRGQITVMGGLSATHFKHCIRSEPAGREEANEMSVSIIFRRVKLASLVLLTPSPPPKKKRRTTASKRKPLVHAQIKGVVIVPEKLASIVEQLGGIEYVRQNRKWERVREKLGIDKTSSSGHRLNMVWSGYFEGT